MREKQKRTFQTTSWTRSQRFVWEKRIAEEQNRPMMPDGEVRTCDMQPAVPIEGSPAKKPCANIGLRGTADEQSAATKINTTAGARTPISAGPVPLFLVAKTISTEIHAHGGDISEIAVKRTGQHVYAITLTKIAPQGKKAGGANAD